MRAALRPTSERRSTRSGTSAWRVSFWLSALLALLLVGSLAPYLTSSTEIVRMRNALLYEPVPAEADWTPASLPADYLVERAPPTQMFSRIGVTTKVDAMPLSVYLGKARGHEFGVDISGRSAPGE